MKRAFSPVLILVLILAAVLGMTSLFPAPADAGGRCLRPTEMKRLIDSRKIVRPRSLRRQVKGEIIRLRLCHRRNGRLIYRVVVLRRNGRIARCTINPYSGSLIRCR